MTRCVFLFKNRASTRITYDQIMSPPKLQPGASGEYPNPLQGPFRYIRALHPDGQLRGWLQNEGRKNRVTSDWEGAGEALRVKAVLSGQSEKRTEHESEKFLVKRSGADERVAH